MFVEGDIFKIEGKEYRLRVVNKHLYCWLEPVLYRDNVQCVTGGLNKVYHMDMLSSLEYMDVAY